MKKGGAVSMPQKRYELLQTLLWHTFSSMRGEVVVVTCVNGEQFVGILLRLEEASKSIVSAIILKHAQRHCEPTTTTVTDSTGAMMVKGTTVPPLTRENNPLTTSDLSKLCSGEKYTDEKRIPMSEFAHLYAPKIGFESEMPTDELGKVRALEEFEFDATEIGISDKDLEWDTGEVSTDTGEPGTVEGSYDQFADKPTTYDENIYTVTFDSSKVSERELNDAKLIAEEIEASETTNIHVLEDRNKITPHTSNYDEEDAFSAVLTSDTKPFIPSKTTPIFTPSSISEHSISSSMDAIGGSSRSSSTSFSMGSSLSKRTMDETFVDSEITAKLSKEGHRGSLKTLRKSELTPAQSLPSIDEEKQSLSSTMPDMQRRSVAQPKLRAAAEAFVPSEQPTMMMAGQPGMGVPMGGMGMTHESSDSGVMSAMHYDAYTHGPVGTAHQQQMNAAMAASAAAAPQYHPHLHQQRVSPATAMQTPVYLPSGGMSHMMGGGHTTPAAAVGQPVLPAGMDPAHHAYYMQQQQRPMAFHPTAHSMHANPAGSHSMAHLIHHMPRHM